MFIHDPKKRRYIYGILTAIGGVLLIYGLVSKEELVVWLALGGSILGNGLAFSNTDTNSNTTGNYDSETL
jgi:hypothetical protein